MRAAAKLEGPEGPLVSITDLASPRRQHLWVSPFSRWSDDRWYFVDPARADHAYGAAVWSFEVLDGSGFEEARYDDLRETAKIVTYCLHRFPAMRSALKAATVNEVSMGIRYFVRWMAASGFGSLASIDTDALADFEDHLVQDKVNEDLDEGLTASSIARYLRAPFAFWEERHRLEAAGLPTMPELPYGGETAHSLATRLSKVALGRIAPIPKEILVPVMNAAERFMEGPASDVVEMARFLGREVPEILADAQNRGTRAQIGRYLGRKVVFRSIDGRPWHAPLDIHSDRIAVKTLEPKSENGIELAKDLVQDVQAAASILLQGTAGLRVSEIEMLEAGGLDPKTGIPDCIEVRFDDTSTVELFYLKGWLVKTTKSKEKAEWLIGARVVGSDAVPPPVLAIQRLHELAQVVDARKASGRLFVGMEGSAWLHFAGHATPHDGKRIQALQRAFMANYVDRGLLDRLEILRTHGWRKSFAQFVFGVDPTLAPALSQHFKHLSLAMTMEAYVTNDPALLGYLDSERAMETARDLYEVTTGRQHPAGRLGKALLEHRREHLEIIAGKTEEEAIAALQSHVLAHQIPFWFLEWGNCGIALSPTEAECHREAGTTSWRNLAPDFGYRDLDVCAGCRRLLILRRHLPFWENRYKRLRAAWDALDDGFGAVFRAALRKKVAQAKGVVRALKREAAGA